MSIAEPPSAGSMGQYGPVGGGYTREPPLTLPPVASLLRHESEATEHQNALAARQYRPPYLMTDQSTWSHPGTQPHSPLTHHPQNYPPPLPADANLMMTAADGHISTSRRREPKRVSQRRHSPPEEVKREERSTLSPSIYEREGSHRGSVDSRIYSRQGSASSASSSSMMPPRNGHQSAMPISQLLSDTPSVPLRAGPTYSIRLRQQPMAARACGFGERDRRVIDPPPILQMSVTDPTATPEQLRAYIRQPYAVVHCVLWDPSNNCDDTAMPGTTDKRQQRRLMGTLVASPFVGKDEHNHEGCFFPFPDLSVRTPGTYSLKFSLVVLDVGRMREGSCEPVRCNAWSESFQVFNAKEFKGMRASTELTKTLKYQGCLISVKKGNAKSGAGTREREEDEEDEEEEEEDDGKKKGKKTKR